MLLSGLVLAGGEASAEELYRIACPLVWPGPGKPDIPVTYAEARKRWDEGINPANENDFFDGTGPGDVQVDCAYGDNPWESPLRITMILPGHPVRCWYPRLGDREMAVCEVRAEADGTLGPVLWRMAEQLGPQTTFLGFGLDRTAAELRATAKAGGFAVAEGEEGRLVLTRDQDQLVARLDPATSRSVEIAWMMRGDGAERTAFIHSLIFRFGYNFRIIDVPGQKAMQTIWRSADQTVAVVTHTFQTDSGEFRSVLLTKMGPDDPRRRKPVETHP
jgi:hypothetical protein